MPVLLVQGPHFDYLSSRLNFPSSFSSFTYHCWNNYQLVKWQTHSIEKWFSWCILVIKIIGNLAMSPC